MSSGYQSTKEEPQREVQRERPGREPRLPRLERAGPARQETRPLRAAHPASRAARPLPGLPSFLEGLRSPQFGGDEEEPPPALPAELPALLPAAPLPLRPSLSGRVAPDLPAQDPPPPRNPSDPEQLLLAAWTPEGAFDPRPPGSRGPGDPLGRPVAAARFALPLLPSRGGRALAALLAENPGLLAPEAATPPGAAARLALFARVALESEPLPERRAAVAAALARPLPRVLELSGTELRSIPPATALWEALVGTLPAAELPEAAPAELLSWWLPALERSAGVRPLPPVPPAPPGLGDGPLPVHLRDQLRRRAARLLAATARMQVELAAAALACRRPGTEALAASALSRAQRELEDPARELLLVHRSPDARSPGRLAALRVRLLHTRRDTLARLAALAIRGLPASSRPPPPLPALVVELLEALRRDPDPPFPLLQRAQRAAGVSARPHTLLLLHSLRASLALARENWREALQAAEAEEGAARRVADLLGLLDARLCRARALAALGRPAEARALLAPQGGEPGPFRALLLAAGRALDAG